MKAEITLRQETKADFPEVFETIFNAFTQENEAKLVDALRKNGTAFIPELSIVAIKDNKVVGHILFTKINIKDDQGNSTESLALAPMAVKPEHQQIGIGRQLICQGFEVAKKLGFESIIVLGHEHYYPKFGFEPADKWNIKAPFDVPSNFFMAIELVPGALKNVSGTVNYPVEFETV